MVDTPWALAVGADLATAGVVGPAMPESALTRDYLAAVQLRAAEDAGIAAAFIRVASLVDAPSALLAPGVVERVGHLESPHRSVASGVTGGQPVT